MEKPYDVKVLLEKLKSRGVHVGEDVAKEIVEDLFSFLEESARASSKPFDGLLILVMSILKPKLMEKLDMIDGEIG